MLSSVQSCTTSEGSQCSVSLAKPVQKAVGCFQSHTEQAAAEQESKKAEWR